MNPFPTSKRQARSFWSAALPRRLHQSLQLSTRSRSHTTHQTKHRLQTSYQSLPTRPKLPSCPPSLASRPLSVPSSPTAASLSANFENPPASPSPQSSLWPSASAPPPPSSASSTPFCSIPIPIKTPTVSPPCAFSPPTNSEPGASPQEPSSTSKNTTILSTTCLAWSGNRFTTRMPATQRNCQAHSRRPAPSSLSAFVLCSEGGSPKATPLLAHLLFSSSVTRSGPINSIAIPKFSEPLAS